MAAPTSAPRLAGVRALVTGGAGFIGSHLTRRLLDEGAWVRVLDDLSAGSLAHLPPSHPRLEFVLGSVADADQARRAVAGCGWVFHQAALASVPASVADPLRTHQVNATGTLNVLVASVEAGVERVVYASSSAVYGPDAALPAAEDAPVRPASPYATTKALGEWYARNLGEARGLQAVGLRYFNVYGPMQDPASPYAAAVPLFARALAQGQPATVFGDGLQTRDFVHVSDVVEANLAAATAGGLPGEVFNVGTGRAVTVLEVVAALARCLGARARVEHAPPRPGDLRHSRASTVRASKSLGFDARVTLEEGLRDTCAWYVGEAAS